MSIFVFSNGSRTGPYTAEEIAGLVKKGDFKMADLVWFEGCIDWMPVHSVPELVDQIVPSLPAVVAPVVAVTQVDTKIDLSIATFAAKPEIAPKKDKIQSTKIFPAKFWPKSWLAWTGVVLLGFPFLIILVLFGKFGILFVIGTVVVAAIVMGMKKLQEPASSPSIITMPIPLTTASPSPSGAAVIETYSGYGARHVAFGMIVIAAAVLLLTIFYLEYFTEHTSFLRCGLFLVASLQCFRWGGSLIVKGRKGIKLMNQKSGKPPIIN